MATIDRESMGGRLLVGTDVRIAESASIDISADVRLGDGVGIAEDVLILTHAHERGHVGAVLATGLAVGAGAFIGERAIILPQVTTIGENAVIGAGAVVTRNVPAGEIWAGNPARKVGR